MYVFLSDSVKKLIRNQIGKSSFTKKKKKKRKGKSQIFYIDFAHINRSTLNKKDSDTKSALHNNKQKFGNFQMGL